MMRALTVFFAWVVVYVTVTTALLGFQWAQADLALPVQTLLLTAILVPLMVLLIGPFAAKLAQYLVRKHP
ncbi:hypothetical protein PsAD2_00914 [Pseudovibrio axinellae]|uniref:Uncharacterized protein n=1 Tax=Pseudovibrio axinellae TaxID=989403 RepID=A0A166ADF3_9HYPH|nr:hypothetical protein [Pseudovibrio axinellae]KZL20922.1 hypothetical protein PsAD2_00914 [Pseudovibrio axinellae]SEP82952.1 hypothetical protein SAMN05421798_101487 [Pseudovibrio axinellae]